MTRIKEITDKNSFKIENLENWKKVSEFWLRVDLSQKKDLIDFYITKICDLSNGREIKFLDVGCGDGWILDTLNTANRIEFSYTGIDFNVNFINHLKNKHKKTNSKFYHIDIEKEESVSALEKYDVIINSFSLFEMPNYELALKNQSKLLATKGSILIISINPLTQLMAISENEIDFRKNASFYAKLKNKLYYRKLIDTGHGFAKQEYLGILHSISDYLKVLKELDFAIVDMEEINLLDDLVPKIYEYVEFKRIN